MDRRRVRQSLMDVIIVNQHPPAPPAPTPAGGKKKKNYLVMLLSLVLLLTALAFVSGYLLSELQSDGLCCISIDTGYHS